MSSERRGTCNTRFTPYTSAVVMGLPEIAKVFFTNQVHVWVALVLRVGLIVEFFSFISLYIFVISLFRLLFWSRLPNRVVENVVS